MFYSHEILTQRKYGVATIWLVATLGSKSILRKVHRKDILSVNVSKACETVIQPGVPLALRLQSNLLYGISRVYSGQCDYLMSDASMAHANIKRLIATTTVNAGNLDLISGGRSRPENLILTDDPAFLPDLNVTQLPDGIDLMMGRGDSMFTIEDSMGLASLQFEKGGSAQPFGHATSHTDISRYDLMATSDTMAGDYGFLPGPGLEDEDDRLLEDVGFEFDADGEMREIPIPQPRDRDSLDSGPSRMKRASTHNIGRSSRLGSEEAAAQVLREHEEGREGSFRAGDDADLYAPPEDNQPDLLDAAERMQGSSIPLGSGEPSTESPPDGLDIEADAPSRRKRAPRSTKAIIDTKTELRNSELKEWRENYLVNMENAVKRSQAAKAPRNAKKNASNLIFEVGFFGQLKNPTLKTLFSPKALLETINGTTDVGNDNKRKRAANASGAEGEDEPGRRTRARTEGLEGEELGLGNLMDEYELPMDRRGDPGEDQVEIGREGPIGMSDGIRPSDQAILPWNAAADRLNRSRAGSLGMSGGIMSVGGFGSSSIGGSQIGQIDIPSRRNSRSAINRLSILGSPIGEGNEEALDIDQEFPVPGEEMEFEYFGAGANVDTQTAQDSQWLAATVEKESTNFFEFLKTELTKHNQQAETEELEPAGFITFGQLLDPAENGRIVAAQAFHHTLFLATKGLVYVSQEEAFGSIQISIV